MSKWLDGLGLVVYCGLIFGLSAQEKLPVPEVFHFQDKLIHAAAYFVMAVFSWRAFRHVIIKPQSLTVLAVMFCSLYGVSDEWHQSFVPGRTTSIGDWLADTIGAVMAMAGLLKFNVWIAPFSSRQSFNN